MKLLEDIFKSVSGNAVAKVSDPFLGAFVTSWIVCNWDKLALLFWGEGSLIERIHSFKNYLSNSPILEFNTLFLIPLFFAAGYVFIYPWLSLFCKSLQVFANRKLHQQDVKIQMDKLINQENLNKLKLMADPTKKFLEKNIEIDIERRQTLLDALQKRRVKRVSDAAASEYKAETEKIILEENRRNEERKQMTLDLEKRRFDVQAKRLASTEASSRFPIAYGLMIALDESLQSDGFKLSLSTISKVIAQVFGYAEMEAVLADENFNNTKLSEVEYVKYDAKTLAAIIASIVSNEDFEDISLGNKIVFEHVVDVFNNFGFQMIDEEEAINIAVKYVESRKNDLLHSKELVGMIQASGYIYEEVEIKSAKVINTEQGFSVMFRGIALGRDKNDSGIRPANLEISFKFDSNILVGLNALGAFELSELVGKFE